MISTRIAQWGQTIVRADRRYEYIWQKRQSKD